METNDQKRIVEINGIKIEVDLRTAKRIDQFKVGDAVKVLVKRYSDDYRSYPGCIVGFDEFQSSPTIIVAYIEHDYSSTELKFLYINAKNKEAEIAPIQEFEQTFNLKNILHKFDDEIRKKKSDLESFEKKKQWFLENWNKYFGKMFKDIECENWKD